MRNLRMVPLLAALLLSFPGFAQETRSAGTTGKLEPLPRDLEIRLALSALPPHLRNEATVYVLDPGAGFEVARKGSNGFHTFVARTGEDTMRGSWPFDAYRDDILYPVSFDAAGAKAHMRVFFDIAAMQAKGTPAAELKALVQQRYKSGYYTPPERAGLSYMLSPILRTYSNPEKSGDVQTTNNPHVMYYAPNVSNREIGGPEPGLIPYPFVTIEGPHGFFIQHVGKMETAAITREYEGMLAELCSIRTTWCLPADQKPHAH
jgi:hypothetical protein